MALREDLDPQKIKVIAYITQAGRLLVFRHIHFPEAGVQVPAGTVEPGEDLEDALFREVAEETGLTRLRLVRYLGVEDFNLTAYGRPQVNLRRHYYHLALDEPDLDTWRHAEEHSSEGPPEPIWFEFFWVSLQEPLPELAGGQGAFLVQLL